LDDEGGNGVNCGGIKVTMDTTKLPDMVIASFGKGQNLVGEGEMLIKDEAKVVSRVGVVKLGTVYLVKLLLLKSNEYEFSLGGTQG